MMNDHTTDLRVRVLHTRATPPTRARPGDAGLDLCALNEGDVEPGGIVTIGTGLAFAIPPGFVGLVRGRSSVELRGLIVVAGVIDSGYRGEVRIAALNAGRDRFAWAAGNRLAQLVIVPVLMDTPRVVGSMEDTQRGDGGFGSSGR